MLLFYVPGPHLSVTIPTRYRVFLLALFSISHLLCTKVFYHIDKWMMCGTVPGRCYFLFNSYFHVQEIHQKLLFYTENWQAPNPLFYSILLILKGLPQCLQTCCRRAAVPVTCDIHSCLSH